jgi:hypothetical protein
VQTPGMGVELGSELAENRAECVRRSIASRLSSARLFCSKVDDKTALN